MEASLSFPNEKFHEIFLGQQYKIEYKDKKNKLRSSIIEPILDQEIFTDNRNNLCIYNCYMLENTEILYPTRLYYYKYQKNSFIIKCNEKAFDALMLLSCCKINNTYSYNAIP